jgi:biopolymer transport protein ExbD
MNKNIFFLILFVLFVVVPVATGTILGWVAVVRIRRSQGKLYGLGIALYAGLLVPLLVLDVLIVLLSDHYLDHSSFGIILPESAWLILWIVVCGLVDYLVVRAVWRAMTKSPEKPGADSSPRESGKKATLRYVLVIGIVSIGAVVGIRLLNDYRENPLPALHAREAVTPHLRAASLRWQEMIFEPNIASPSKAVVRFAGLEERRGINGNPVWQTIDGYLNLGSLGGDRWKATGMKGLGHLQFDVELERSDQTALKRRPFFIDTASFGPTMATRLSGEDLDHSVGLDLDTGTLVRSSKQFEKRGVDLVYDSSKQWHSRSMYIRATGSFLGVDELTPEFAKAALRFPWPEEPPGPALNELLLSRDAYFFATREGNVGALRIEEIRPAYAGTLIRYRLVQSEKAVDSVARAKKLPVTPPDPVLEHSELNAEQLKQVFEGITWSDFIEDFADEGQGDKITWKELESEGEAGPRFEIGFPFKGETMLLDLVVDPAFEHAVPSRLRPARHPDQVEEDASRFLPFMLMRYARQSGHPAMASVIKKAETQAFQREQSSTIRQYLLGIMRYQETHDTLPADLQELVGGGFMNRLLKLRNPKTGDEKLPVYLGGEELQMAEVQDASDFMLLASPFVGADGKRVVGFLDGHTGSLDETDYQAKLERQRMSPMERALDDFLRSCVRKGVTTRQQMFDALGMAEFRERFGDGEKAFREHHDQLPEVMRFFVAKDTGEPNPEFAELLRSRHENVEGKEEARLKLLVMELLGIRVPEEVKVVADAWTGTFRALGPNGNPEIWRIAKVEGDYYWLESPDATISDHKRLTLRDGALIGEDGAERFGFTRADETNLGFTVVSKETGEKAMEQIIQRIEPEDEGLRPRDEADQAVIRLTIRTVGDGVRYAIDGETMPFESFRTRLRSRLREISDPRVIFEVEPTLPHREVSAVMEMLGEAGVEKVSFRSVATDAAGADPPEGTRADESVFWKVWTCPDHPEVKTPSSGRCPICAGPLEKVSDQADADEGQNADGAGLEFRIAPTRDELDGEAEARWKRVLEDGKVGAWWEREEKWREPLLERLWLPVTTPSANTEGLVVGEYDGVKHLLVSNKPADIMLRGTGGGAWGLEAVEAVNASGAGVVITFDESGGKRFKALTGANIDRALAVVVDGEVVSVPVIRSAMAEGVILCGLRDMEQANELAAKLEGAVAKSAAPGHGGSEPPGQ